MGMLRLMWEPSEPSARIQLAPFLHADLVQQGGEQHPGPLAAGQHAVAELQAVHLRTAPLHAAVGGAFQEADHAHRGEAHQVVHGEDDRAFHHAVNHQPVLLRVDIRQARMKTLEDDPGRGNDAT